MTLPAVTFAEKIAGVAYRPGPYRLPEGGTLDTYFDPYRLAGDPELLAETAAALASLLPAGTEVLAGPALAGIPLVTAVSLHTGLPAAFLRPSPKEHGTWQQIEGAELSGRQTVLLDDTARSGTSLLRSARLLRMGGARVGTALCVLDRDAGAATLLADHHIVLRALVQDPDGAR
ncbi:orotate phosphoribosyltransferase (plasmid) [Streptomyces sp. NBC_01591]|uniref:orotate phosphoribosyltransferase n=1 Tax=Streptomyces sp. NBC_01591 TaxID=2975888 RepID=UPI002DDC7990|nr:phosphoribosyltransferase family protein [Streptomyces sp. NBC_01591]WSD66113.1 orotate phosphoribosyltransferase [Streptomyces sp. NBC_01591]WSD73004.1 orotate phosphoribosyltransferase [Streptomyces sp. NBC_01591]WSD73719.1 orotate phosphoribosyltransferase [Streptomyces sp. NBC_01591]WSD74493.1 orotate phosphoribosyltransferase [Streptomyces sp. NBC_01591]